MEECAKTIATEGVIDPKISDQLDLERMHEKWGRWLRVLHRIEIIAGLKRPLRFTKASTGWLIGETGVCRDPRMPEVNPDGMAIAADYVMTEGVHSVEFTVDPQCGSWMHIGVVHADWEFLVSGEVGNHVESEHATNTAHGWALVGPCNGDGIQGDICGGGVCHQGDVSQTWADGSWCAGNDDFENDVVFNTGPLESYATFSPPPLHVSRTSSSVPCSSPHTDALFKATKSAWSWIWTVAPSQCTERVKAFMAPLMTTHCSGLVSESNSVCSQRGSRPPCAGWPRWPMTNTKASPWRWRRCRAR